MTATFTWLPSYTSKRSFKPQLNVARFGDGYAQIAQAGINPVIRSYDLTFNAVTDADADAIEVFLIENNGISFEWTAPGDTGPTNWICLTDYSREHVNPNVNKMAMTFEQQGQYTRGAGPGVFDFSTMDGWTWEDETDVTWSNGDTGLVFDFVPNPADVVTKRGLYRNLPRGKWRIELGVVPVTVVANSFAYETKGPMAVSLELWSQVDGHVHGSGTFVGGAHRYASLSGSEARRFHRWFKPALDDTNGDAGVGVSLNTEAKIRVDIDTESRVVSVSFPEPITHPSFITTPRTGTYSTFPDRIGIFFNSDGYDPFSTQRLAGRLTSLSITPLPE